MASGRPQAKLLVNHRRDLVAERTRIQSDRHTISVVLSDDELVFPRSPLLHREVRRHFFENAKSISWSRTRRRSSATRRAPNAFSGDSSSA
jgi:hypothetical protein